VTEEDLLDSIPDTDIDPEVTADPPGKTGRCERCGRRLKNPDDKIGPTCRKK